MSDGLVVVLAVAAMAGGWWARPVPALVAGAAVVAAIVVRRPLVVITAAVVLASFLGARAWAGVEGAATSGRFDGEATAVGDPERVLGGTRIELRLQPGGRRVQATAAAGSDAASILATRLAGDRLRVGGRLRAVTPRSRAYLARRHIGSRLTVDQATDPRPGGPVARFANEVRRTLVAGTGSMSPERRALFTGLVIGDDRDQAPREVDDFRAAGLSHLLAVSGQNVAFVLAVAAPFLRRLGLRGRLVGGVAVLLVFGVLTRWEPSVVRAVAMAALSMLAATVGRPASSLRILALAVTALVLIDPMLSGSVGFLLSVGACTGIGVVGPWLEARRVPATLAVTLAAQVGVAPVLVPVFGGVPLASVPANLLAVPAAGPVMVWGLVAGLPAGLLGGRAAWLLHLPTRILLAWIAGVARTAAALPLPQLDLWSLGALAAAMALALGGSRVARGRGRVPRVLAAAGVLALAPSVASAVSAVSSATSGRAGAGGGGAGRSDGARPAAGTLEPQRDELAAGVDLYRGGRESGGGAVLVVSGAADEGALLEALRTRGVRRVDVLVLRSGGSSAARLAAAVAARSAIGMRLAPRGNQVPAAQAVTAGTIVRAGGVEVVVEAAGPPLRVRVGSPGSCASRSGPAATTCPRAPS